ncbi:MAG: hypothetical protein CMH27_09795 [Micavibrio sp.]|nr:hypothetical protein [Micavibrio sp.]|tara:strand:+ start:322 stop:900 length:579 start_codon:yes stop_codon:yes gene_type:complete
MQNENNPATDDMQTPAPPTQDAGQTQVPGPDAAQMREEEAIAIAEAAALEEANARIDDQYIEELAREQGLNAQELRNDILVTTLATDALGKHAPPMAGHEHGPQDTLLQMLSTFFGLEFMGGLTSATGNIFNALQDGELFTEVGGINEGAFNGVMQDMQNLQPQPAPAQPGPSQPQAAATTSLPTPGMNGMG